MSKDVILKDVISGGVILRVSSFRRDGVLRLLDAVYGQLDVSGF